MEPLRGDEVTAVPAGVVSRTRDVADVSYRAFLATFDGPRVYWSTPDGLEVAGVGAVARLRAAGPDRFETLRHGADRLFETVDADGPLPARPRAFGGVAFHEDHEPGPPWTGFPAAEFVLPRAQLVRVDGRTLLTVSETGESDPSAVDETLAEVTDRVENLPAMRPVGDPPGIEQQRHQTTREEWMAGVERAVQRIESGDLRKVVLASALAVDLTEPVTVTDVLERLRRTYPGCFRFLVGPNGAEFFGAPPERLVSLSGRSVTTEALAGSVPRGDTPEKDEELARSLLESEKLQEEQGLVAEAIREQLAPLGTVEEGDQRVRKLATIQHLETPIEARLDADEHVLSLVEALHPTPAVGGLPPDLAMQTIRDTEPFERGWYASPVGWFDGDGDGEFAVGIRSGVAEGSRVTLFGGNGIVADSDPEEEWAEVQLKYRPILDELDAE